MDGWGARRGICSLQGERLGNRLSPDTPFTAGPSRPRDVGEDRGIQEKGNAMGATTHISWTDATWNPWTGCRKISQGCHFCYMYRDKTRYGQDPAAVVRSKDATFYAPLHWEKKAVRAGHTTRVFTCSWSDFFIEEADAWRPLAWEVIRQTPHLTYQILTKRPERMLEHLPWHDHADSLWDTRPWSHVWLGVSVEDQATADARIPWLLQTPAALRFVSYEPALAAVDFFSVDFGQGYKVNTLLKGPPLGERERLDWIIVGGESGPQARPCNLVWLTNTVRQTGLAGVACWVKQLGAKPCVDLGGSARFDDHTYYRIRDKAGATLAEWPTELQVQQFPDAVTL